MPAFTRAAACVLALAVASPGLACMPPTADEFRKYPAQHQAGVRNPVDFSSHPVAAALVEADRARVQKAADAGPNFAGAYRVVYAPCGERCTALLVVSLATGKVLRVPAADNAYADFRVYSTLIRVRTRDGQNLSHYLFDGSTFSPIEVTPES